MNDTKSGNLLINKSVVLPLLFILCFGILYRVTFINGVVYQTDFDHVALAYQFSTIIHSFFSTVFSGNWSQLNNVIDSFQASIQTYGSGSSIAYLPVSISYAIFGVNDFAGLVFPLSCSLLGSLFLFGTGSILGGQKAGLVCAFLWSILPIEIFYSTIISTALPIFMFSQAGIYLFLLINHTDKNKKLLILLDTICILVLLFINPASLAILLFYIVYWIRNQRNKKIFLIGFTVTYLIFIVILCFVHHISDFPQAFFKLYQSASQEDGWLIFLVLLLSALVGYSQRKTPDLSIPLLWLITVYPVLSLTSYMGIGIEKSLLMFYAPVVIIIAIFLTNLVTEQETRNITIINVVILSIIIWLAGREKDIDVLLNQQALFTPALIYPLSTISLGISFIGAVITNVYVTGVKKTWKKISLFLLLWLVGVSLIQFVNSANRYARHVQISSSETYDFFVNTDITLLIYSDDPFISQRLLYLSDFQMTNLMSDIVSIPGEEINFQNIEDAYIILPTNSAIEPQENWVPLKRTGSIRFNNYWIYRALSDVKANTLIHDYHIFSDETTEQLQKKREILYGANINAGNLCQGYLYWMDYAEYSEQIQYIPVINSHCFQFRGENLIDSTEWEHSPYSYGPQSITTENDSVITTFHKTKYTDLNTIYRYVQLKPQTFYFLEISVRSEDTQTMIVPYLSIENHEFYLEAGQYPQWKKLQMVFKTPDSSSDLLTTYISPFLFEGSHISHFKDFQIREIQTD